MSAAPHTIFIVPYRDRQEHKARFDKFFEELKTHKGWSASDVRIVYSHQCDTRPFNRGAVKNIGFLAMQQEYPEAWPNITFVFHDVDSIPSTADLFRYEAIKGSVSHYYGYAFALGGMFAIKGADFAAAGGFPNFWGWGLEDNVINERVLASGLKVDRSEFVPIRDKRVWRPFDGYTRNPSNREVAMYKFKEQLDGFSDIRSLAYSCVNEYVNITGFDTPRTPEQGEMTTIDIRAPTAGKVKVQRGYFRKKWSMTL